MIVYRLEDEKGYGVWAAYKGELLESHHGLYERGRSVGSPWSTENYRYGCDSLESLMQYFGTGFGLLLTKGFHVVKYKVRKNYVESSPIELIFAFEKAECLGRVIPKTDMERLREYKQEQLRGKDFKQIYFDEYTTMPLDWAQVTVSPRPPQIFGEAV